MPAVAAGTPALNFILIDAAEISDVAVGAFKDRRDRRLLSPLQCFQTDLREHIAQIRFEKADLLRSPAAGSAIVQMLQPPTVPTQPV